MFQRSAHLAICLTLFINSSCALPIPPVHSSGPSLPVCLVVLAALLLGLLLLVFLKRVYIQKRRVKSGAQNSMLSLPVGSTSAMASVDSVSSQSEKAGFIVGFFSSPAVEIQCALEQAEWKESKESSFTDRIHTESRRPRTDYLSVLDISLRRNRSVSTSLRALEKSPILRETHPFKLPSPPDKAYITPMPLHPRRFSLPIMTRSVAHDAQRRRHSSLKSARSRRSVAFVPGSPSLRIVDHSPATLDAPLPLSRQLSDMASSTPSPLSRSNPLSPKFSSRLSRSFIPPLPPLPFTNAPSSTTQRSAPLQISHPYALSLHPRKNVPTSPPSQTDPKLPTQLRHPVLSPNTDFAPLELPVLGEPLSPTLSSFPTPPPVASILKPKLKIRTRRSPAIGPIGPSPLRTMILPESTNSDLSSHALKNKENLDGMDRPLSVNNPYASLDQLMRSGEVGSGSGSYGGVAKGGSTNVVPNASRRYSVPSRHASKAEEDDPNILLGIIRELVEETNEWDPSSMFMSQNFKTLIQESSGITSTSVREGSVVGQTEEPSGFAESDQSSRSTEVNLGLLGLDMFKNESVCDFDSYNIEDSTNLVSFWDESSGERSEVVGLAW
ncbi:hypothetical protein B0H11DRAFT_1968907 [Mycena galericulata]|nr:hypothetical protein B0H11DRAFT_1968907 [Mycena galericulata]